MGRKASPGPTHEISCYNHGIHSSHLFSMVVSGSRKRRWHIIPQLAVHTTFYGNQKQPLIFLYPFVKKPTIHCSTKDMRGENNLSEYLSKFWSVVNTSDKSFNNHQDFSIHSPNEHGSCTSTNPSYLLHQKRHRNHAPYYQAGTSHPFASSFNMCLYPYLIIYIIFTIKNTHTKTDSVGLVQNSLLGLKSTSFLGWYQQKPLYNIIYIYMRTVCIIFL